MTLPGVMNALRLRFPSAAQHRARLPLRQAVSLSLTFALPMCS